LAIYGQTWFKLTLIVRAPISVIKAAAIMRKAGYFRFGAGAFVLMPVWVTVEKLRKNTTSRWAG
jgi:hypothetical protein